MTTQLQRTQKQFGSKHQSFVAFCQFLDDSIVAGDICSDNGTWKSPRDKKENRFGEMHYLFKSDMLRYQALEAGGAVSNLDKLQGSLNKMQFVGNCHDRKEYKWARGL